MRASVVVPTYRRPDLLDRCLRALVAQEIPSGEFEIVVADDAASDATRNRVATFPGVRYVAVSGAHGPAAARNAGWRSSRGEIVAFTDDDTVPDPRWLAVCLAAFDRDPELQAVTGRVIVPLPEDPTDYERDAAGLEGAEFVTANCACRRAALEAVGGFDERFSAAWREDSDLQFMLMRRGMRIARVAEAIVVHPVRPARWGVSLKQQRKSQFDALLYKKHGELYRRKIGAGPPRDYYAIVASLAAAATFTAVGRSLWAGLALLVWATLTAMFCARRLARTSRSPVHVAEMAVTSAMIPPLSVFWRLYGAWKFRVIFF